MSVARYDARVLVIGSGVAGLFTAWRAAQYGSVILLTKRTLRDSNTMWAQGGIAAALGAGDSPDLHRADTLAAGGALCDVDAVDVLVREGPDRVRELVRAGARFDRTESGAFKLGKEAAHSPVVCMSSRLRAHSTCCWTVGAVWVSPSPSMAGRRRFTPKRLCWRLVDWARCTATPPIPQSPPGMVLPLRTALVRVSPTWSLCSSTQRPCRPARIRWHW
jgi:hypothetical protein